MAGVRGKKTPGKPGRFDPSEPLHMTTRRAAKTTTFYGSDSVNGSMEDETSRRGSFDDLRPLTSHSNGSQVSAKSRRLSELSATNVTPDNQMNGIHSSEEKRSGRSNSKPLSPVAQTPSPSRKRKRSSSTPPQPHSVQPPDSVESTSFENYHSGLTFADDEGAVDVIRPEDLSDRERPPSQESFDSEVEAAQGDVMMGEASIDATPAVSEPVSPVTSESRSQEDPLTAPLDAALEKITQAVDDDQDEQDEVDDAADAGDEIEVEEADEVDEQADEDGRPRRGRFGGRRRAKHPNPKVEKAMQRQAELKSAYRAIARAQKAVLAEIAQRTIDDLETNRQLHIQAVEYQDVKSGLDSAYTRRRNQLQSQQTLNVQQLDRTLEAEQQMLTMIYSERLAELKEEMLVSLEHKMLKIARQAQLEENATQDETEDEDDVVPKPKRTGYRWSRSGAIESAFDSRSRVTMDTMRATADMEGRFNMHQMLKELDGEDKLKDLPGFTVMDPTHREIADHKRLSVQNTNVLAAAAAHKEAIIPNEQAYGLQILGELAQRPSIALSVPPPSTRSKGSREFLVDHTPPRPMPPHLHLQTSYRPNSIPVEMSPRTTQAMGDRFDTTMPPPLTPRQGVASFIRSPDAMRTEFLAMSPSVHTPRLNGQAFRRLSDSRPESRRGPYFEHINSPADRMNQHPERRGEMPPSPFRNDESRNEIAGWREYPNDFPPTSARRTSFNNEQTSFTFSRGVIEGGERGRNSGLHAGEKYEDQDAIKNESSPYNPLDRRPLYWGDPLSQPGAPDARHQHAGSPEIEQPPGWRPLFSAPRSPTHSRNTSQTFSVHDRRRDSEAGDSQQQKAFEGRFKHHKSSKEERGGLPRRHWSKEHKKLSRSFDKPGSAGSPTTASASYAGSPVERAPPPAPWQSHPPPQHSPIGPPPPTAMYQPPSVPYGPPHPQYSPGPPGHDFYQHRNSFPPPPHQAPASIWNQPQSHLYAIPQTPHPPPPGVPPEQYSRFAPPPPPGYQPASHLPPPPTPQPQSAPGSYGHQFGGQPLAPATANPSFHPPGIRPAQPPPAFAQQAQQQHGGFANRRRATSDANVPKFHTWHPPRR